MDITLDKKNTTEGSLKISLKEKDYQPQVEEKIKDYSKKANIKGFRPGKVPSSYIKKIYGKSILVDEINKILSQSITSYIKENKINILGEPLPNSENTNAIDWETQKEFDFEYSIGMVDNFNYDISPKVKITSYQITVDDNVMKETLDNVKLQYGKMLNPETSEPGDAIYGNLVHNEFSKDLLIDLINIDKKHHKLFSGLKKDDKITFDLHKVFPDTHKLSHLLEISEDETKEMKGNVDFTVININRKEPSELNQELFDKVFGPGAVSSEKEFLDKIKATIAENYERESKSFLNYSIEKEIINNTKINLPDEFLKKWLLISNQGKITQEDISKEYDHYIQDLKWTLIQNKIYEDQELKIEHEDVQEKAKEIIREQFIQSGLGAQIESNIDAFVKNYLQGDEGNNYYKVFNQARADKILSFIRENITISNKKVDVEKFKKLVSS